MTLASVFFSSVLLAAQVSTFESPRGPVTYKESSYSDDGAEALGMRGLTQAELKFVRDNANQAGAFIASYVPPAQRKADLLANLDLAFAAWLDSDNPHKETPAAVEAIVGAAFGQYCVAHLPVKWVVQNDAQGTELAIVGANPFSKSFPMAAVRYRIEDNVTDFIGALYEALVHFRAEAGSVESKSK